MTAKYTPGPWQSKNDYTTDGFVTIIANVDGETHSDGTHSHSYDTICRCEDEYGERLPNVAANVKAICALPDLIEALMACRRAVNHGHDEPRHNVREIVHHALAKAGVE